MSFALPFLFGVGLGGLITWIIAPLSATAHPAHAATHEALTVHSIAARIESERLAADHPDRRGEPIAAR
ncbi:hypothetical protein [Nocardia sp. CC227C]|uniref:hypothetical protein n=1 Tax=Nocardia sp. CC227C TaxID=3044562 RepID=UPI00278C394C|nr:hypothetical protein [Nocardia sp. CC227C]